MGEGLDGADGIDHLLGIGADIGDAILRAPRQGAHAAAEEQDRHHHRGDDDQHQRGQLRAGHHQHDEAADEDEQVAQRHRHARADDGLQQRRVGGEPRQDLAGLGGFEIGRAQRDDAIENGDAQIGHHPLADPGHQREAAIGRHRQYGDDGQQRLDGAVEEVRVAGAQALVDDMAHALAEQQHGRRGDDQRDARAEDLPAVGPQKLEKAEQRRQVARARRAGGIRRRRDCAGGSLCARHDSRASMMGTRVAARAAILGQSS